MPIKIYTNISFLSQPNRSNIFFIFLELCYTKDDWIKSYFDLVETANQADFLVWPLCLSYTRRIGKYQDYINFVNEANQLKKQVWVFTGGDEGLSNFKAPDNCIHFRLAGFKSKYTHTTEVLPAFIQDPLQNKVFNIHKLDNPSYTIGFVGHADNSLLKLSKELAVHFKKKYVYYNKYFVDSQKFYPSGYKRAKFLNLINRIPLFESNFIMRKKYRAGPLNNYSKRKQTESEFKKNIQESLFTFCLRGGGNFSIRFYETLAQGRIPFYVDTDTQLPLADIINWDNHILRISPSDNQLKIQDKLKNFIQKHDLEEMQKQNRNLWLTRMTRKGYARQLYLKYQN
jgi:hypothetical protein